MTRDFDSILQEVGEFGKYQKFVVWLLCVPTCFVNAFNAFVFIFQAYTPEFRCEPNSIEHNGTFHLYNINNNETEFSDHCNANIPCEKYIYKQNYFRSTLITDFDLICDRAIIWKNILSFLNAISIVGCIFYSYIQDKWGRKASFILSLSACLFGGISSLFVNNPIWFTILRTPWSLSAIATWNIGYIWALEYVGPSKRAFVTSVLNLLYGVASVSLALLAYISRTWIELGLLTTLPFILLFSYYFLIDESPRWLLSKGKKEDTMKILEKMIKWQKKPALSREVLEEFLKNEKNEIEIKIEKRCNDGLVILQLFRQRNIRLKTVIISYAWMSISIVYNSIAYNVENLGGNLYLTYVLQAVVEIPACLLALPALNRYGRLIPLFFSLLIAGIFSFIAIPAQILAGDWGMIVAATASKFSICLSYCCIHLLAGESYPTPVRGLGTGLSSAVGDAGTIFMPYIVHSVIVHEMLPMIILGTMSVLAAFTCLFLPDTKDQNLPETVDEAEKQGLVKLETFMKNWAKLFQWKTDRPNVDEISL